MGGKHQKMICLAGSREGLAGRGEDSAAEESIKGQEGRGKIPRSTGPLGRLTNGKGGLGVRAKNGVAKSILGGAKNTLGVAKKTLTL